MINGEPFIVAMWFYLRSRSSLPLAYLCELSPTVNSDNLILYLSLMEITGSILLWSKWYVKWNINLASLAQFDLKSYYFFIYLISAYYWEAPHLWLHVDFCSSALDVTTL